MYFRTLMFCALAVAAPAAAGAQTPAPQPAPAQPAASQAAPSTGQPAPIRNFLQITPDFCTGGQPSMEHFAKLKADGVKAVLNLRTPGEQPVGEEQAAVEKAGLKYFNIPVVASAPTDAQADEFLKLTDDPANRPMFIHCAAAVRAGAFWMIRRVVRDGMPVDAAREEARKAGFGTAPALEAFVTRYVEAKKKKT